jgi:NNP family nitrate/nitrite transporter-like MFS transporter
MPKNSNLPDVGTNQPQLQAAFRDVWPALVLLTSIFFLNFSARIVLAPLMPAVESDLGISHAEGGSLFLLISLGYFAALLASGFITSRLTHKQTIISSNIALGFALLVTSFSSGLWGMRLGLIMVGMATGPYIPSGIATLTTLVRSRDWGKAIGTHELAPNSSFVLAPLVCEAVLYWFTWRTVFMVLGIATFVLAGVFARFGRGGEFQGEFVGCASYLNILSKPSFWIMVILFSLGISSTLGIYTMLPLYLVTDHGMERNWANTLIALSRIAGIAMTLIGGWATDRIGPKQILRVVFLLTGLLTMFIGFASSSWVDVAVFLQPLVAVCFFPAGLAALSMVGSPKERNIMVSLTVPIAFLVGGGGSPSLIGFFGDVGFFGLGIAFVGGLIFMGTIFSGYLKFHDQNSELLTCRKI